MLGFKHLFCAFVGASWLGFRVWEALVGSSAYAARMALLWYLSFKIRGPCGIELIMRGFN